MQNDRYDALDGLRTFACLGIVAMHLQANLGLTSLNMGVVGNTISFMGDFVLLFMMLSAFSLCCGYLTRIQNGELSVNEFYLKRYKRILPFFAFLVIVDVIKTLLENHFSWSDIVIGSLWEAFANVTLVFALEPGNGISVVGVGWFLGVIFLFYMLFPFFCFLLQNKKRAWVSLGVSFLWYFAIREYFSPVKGAVSGNTCMLVVAPYFLVGGILFLYVSQIKAFFQKRMRRNMLCLLTFLYTVLFFLAPECRFLFSNLLMYTLWLTVAVSEATFGHGGTFLNNVFTRFVSAISMEIYLSHMMFFRFFEKIHVDKIINNRYVLYIVVFLLVVVCSGLFSFVWKRNEKRFLN